MYIIKTISTFIFIINIIFFIKLQKDYFIPLKITDKHRELFLSKINEKIN